MGWIWHGNSKFQFWWFLVRKWWRIRKRLESNKESSHYLSSNDQSFANEHQSAFLSKVQNTFLIANGEEIADFNQLPVSPQQTDVVYDGSNGRAWIWDIAFDYQVRQQFYADFKFFSILFRKKFLWSCTPDFPLKRNITIITLDGATNSCNGSIHNWFLRVLGSRKLLVNFRDLHSVFKYHQNVSSNFFWFFAPKKRS